MIEKWRQSRASEMPGTMFYISSNSWYIIITMLDNSMTITIITLIITMYYASIYLKKTHTHTHHVVLGISKTVTQDHKGSPSARRVVVWEAMCSKAPELSVVLASAGSPWNWLKDVSMWFIYGVYMVDICFYIWYLYMNYIGFIYGLYIFIYSLYDMVLMAYMIDVRGFLMICKYIYSFDMIWYDIYNYINYYFYCYKRACFRI